MRLLSNFLALARLYMCTNFSKLVRKLTSFAWKEMLWDVSRVEWKFGRNEDGSPKDWDEWNNIREHLVENGSLRQPKEIK